VSCDLRITIDDLRAGENACARVCWISLRTLIALAFISAENGKCADGWSKLNRTNLLQFVENGEVRPVRSVSDWEKRRASIKEAMQEVMGRLPGAEKRCPLEVRIEEEADGGSYVRRFISYAAEPGERVSAYLLIPKSALKAGSKVPGVLALHQTHALGQKVVVGLSNSTNDEYGVSLVKRGFVVLAPPYPLLANYQPDLKKLGYQSGTMKPFGTTFADSTCSNHFPTSEPTALGPLGILLADTTRFIPLSSMSESTWSSQAAVSIRSAIT